VRLKSQPETVEISALTNKICCFVVARLNGHEKKLLVVEVSFIGKAQTNYHSCMSAC